MAKLLQQWGEEINPQNYGFLPQKLRILAAKTT
jgi:hypothetical protein